jgi:hypothetical protein
MGRELIGAQFILEQQKKDYEEKLEEQKRYIKIVLFKSKFSCFGKKRNVYLKDLTALKLKPK